MDPQEPFIRRPEATALLVIDMQNDFLVPDGPLPAAGGMALVRVIADLARRARRAGAPVIFTQEAHRPGYQDFGIERFFEPIHCVEGGTGIDIVDGLAPEPSDLIVGAKRRIDGLMLRATDTGWTTGSGPEVTGPHLSLILAMTGRPAALADLSGEGLGILKSRS